MKFSYQQDPRLLELTSGESHFFGFHDLMPWNEHTAELVCLRTDVNGDHVPTFNDSADVIVVNENDRSVVKVGETLAWNWQKGARQRWLPNFGRRVIAYNATNRDAFECRIIDLDSHAERVLPLPLYDISDKKGFGLSLNFRRLYRCQPGYGYDHSSPEIIPDYDKDGIFRVDLRTSEMELILSVRTVALKQGMSLDSGEHYFTHIQIAPNGERYAFVHRFILASGGIIDRFVVADAHGRDFCVLLDDKISHFDWHDDEHLIVWCRKNAAIRLLKESRFRAIARFLYSLSRRMRLNAVRQNVYNESFREIDLRSGKSVAVGKGVLKEDGHPQLNPVFPNIWVTDTYPDGNLSQTLILYNQTKNRRIDILRLPTQESIRETPWRCDFHPRWHPDGKRICIDSSHNSRRQICILDVEKEVHDLMSK